MIHVTALRAGPSLYVAVDWHSLSGPPFPHLQSTLVRFANIPSYLVQAQWKASRITLQGALLNSSPTVGIHEGSLTPGEGTWGETAYLGT